MMADYTYPPPGGAKVAENHKDNNAGPKSFRCPLMAIGVPKDHLRALRKLLKPFSSYLPVLTGALELAVEGEETVLNGNKSISTQYQIPAPPPYSVSGDQLSSPAIAVILLLPENGVGSASTATSAFHQRPWRLHHKIQIQDKSSLSVIGFQEFHFLSRTFPLWSAITIPESSGRLRIHVFVRRYHAMVEFYRLVTNTEMESRKPGFCVFPLDPDGYKMECNNTNLNFPLRDGDTHSCELALKQCAHVDPYPLPHISLIFPVRNFESLRALLHSDIQPLSTRHYLVRDPDGNSVILYDTNPRLSSSDSHRHTPHLPAAGSTRDKVSAHSGSIDSGHFSDSDYV